ncbi:hypothetical protein AVEN_235210-1 [Araneus ventricosus]|uniref:Uncharacterized protein n=1 Tax=Araneus ventricosus TaxID=182803 RepID=A0A4Y2MR85_ARAVE|nr:hypothetical protein AVEN_235210-1 [Araneus ventricosus]
MNFINLNLGQMTDRRNPNLYCAIQTSTPFFRQDVRPSTSCAKAQTHIHGESYAVTLPSRDHSTQMLRLFHQEIKEYFNPLRRSVPADGTPNFTRFSTVKFNYKWKIIGLG